MPPHADAIIGANYGTRCFDPFVIQPWLDEISGEIYALYISIFVAPYPDTLESPLNGDFHNQASRLSNKDITCLARFSEHPLLLNPLQGVHDQRLLILGQIWN
ncbi:MAG: hypothetical protein ACR5K4_03630 [Sodalis sp. (in: enterobacteria)]